MFDFDCMYAPTLADTNECQMTHINSRSEAKPDIHLLKATPTASQRNLQDEAAKLEQRAREIGQEVQSQSTIGRHNRAASEDTRLLSRTMVLELGQLVRDLQDLAQKLSQETRAHPKGKAKYRAL